jgi:diguanylate cyclase (GGDEF)-like protein
MAPSPTLPAPPPDEPAADAVALRPARGIAYGVLAGRAARTFVLLGALLVPTAFAATDVELGPKLQAIEVDLLGFPGRAETELDALAAQINGADAPTRRYGLALLAQARIAAAHIDAALKLADQLELEGRKSQNDATAAVALLIRSDAQVWSGDVPHANMLANHARTVAQNAGDGYVRFWAAMTAGITARLLGQVDEALVSLREAYALADAAQHSYRRASALYQLSVLDRATKQPERALDESRQAFHQAKLAGSTFFMAKAKMAESAALEGLDQPEGELAAMQEALAIARTARSGVEESLALINLADVYLRRKDFQAVLEMSQQSLDIASESQDGALIATNKANMGFALFGLGRMEAGKRLAEEALAETERTGASAEIADLMAEYGHYLAAAGDYKGALALRDRQQQVIDRIVSAARQRDLLELRSKFDSERRIDRLELRDRESQQRMWLLFTVMSAASFLVVAVLYRKVQNANRLLARRNTELGFYSTRDPLTSLYNRRHFQHFISEAPPKPDRRSGAIAKPVQAILLIDLDHFKAINDRYGHAAGDAVLVAVAQRLRDALRETEMIVRWGGEEFLVFVPLAPADRLEEIVMRVLRTVSEAPVIYQCNEIRITVSIGYSPMMLPPNDAAPGWERVLDLADQALYEAKKRGRNRAFGVVGLRATGAAAYTAIDGGLDKAWRDGVVDAIELLGAAATIVGPACPAH